MKWKDSWETPPQRWMARPARTERAASVAAVLAVTVEAVALAFVLAAVGAMLSLWP